MSCRHPECRGAIDTGSNLVNVPVDDGEVGGADVQLRHDGNVRHQEAGNKLCDNNTFKSSHLLQCLAATN